MALSNEKKQALGERMFINDGDSPEYIANTVGVGLSTVYRWIKNGNWEDRRKQILTAPHKIKEFMDTYMLKIIEEETVSNDDVKKADALVKISAAREKLDKGITVHTVISVFKEFNSFLTEINADFAITLTDFEKMFIQHKGEMEL